MSVDYLNVSIDHKRSAEQIIQGLDRLKVSKRWAVIAVASAWAVQRKTETGG
jgi:hypothetical protein